MGDNREFVALASKMVRNNAKMPSEPIRSHRDKIFANISRLLVTAPKPKVAPRNIEAIAETYSYASYEDYRDSSKRVVRSRIESSVKPVQRATPNTRG